MKRPSHSPARFARLALSAWTALSAVGIFCPLMARATDLGTVGPTYEIAEPHLLERRRAEGVGETARRKAAPEPRRPRHSAATLKALDGLESVREGMQYQRSLIEQLAARVGLSPAPRRGARPGRTNKS